MTDQHPITPPLELVKEWMNMFHIGFNNIPPSKDWIKIFAPAVQWGADQELEACWEWLVDRYGQDAIAPLQLRNARRPKPPSLKEQALALIDSNSSYLDDSAMDIIRQALEQLPD